MNTRRRGTDGESIAVDYLEKKGYRILQRNYRFHRGEIDIVARDEDQFVFVEVKSRRSDSYGEPEDAITTRKHKQLCKIAQGYMLRNNIEEKDCRFDVISIKYTGEVPVILHLIDAF